MTARLKFQDPLTMWAACLSDGPLLSDDEIEFSFARQFSKDIGDADFSELLFRCTTGAGAPLRWVEGPSKVGQGHWDQDGERLSDTDVAAFYIVLRNALPIARIQGLKPQELTKHRLWDACSCLKNIYRQLGSMERVKWILQYAKAQAIARELARPDRTSQATVSA